MQHPIMLLIVAIAGLALLGPAAADKPCDKGHSHPGIIPQGEELKVKDLDVYVAFPAKKWGHHGRKYPAVILVSDIYGWKQASTRKWADDLAAAGYLVLLPDLFKGDSWAQGRTDITFDAWLAKFPQATVLSELKGIISHVKRKGVKGFRASCFGAQGFCWGGKYSLLLVGDQPAVAAGVVFHGSRITLDDVKAVSRPISFLQSDPTIDVNNFGVEFYKQVEGVLADKRAKGLDARLRSYTSAPHGFTLRGDPNNAQVQAAAKDAFQRGLDFLDLHVKRGCCRY